MINRIKAAFGFKKDSNQDSPQKDSNNPQNQQYKQNSAKDGNDFAKILLEISEQEQANEYANTNTTATQERTHFNANGRGLGRLETSHTPSTQQPKTISIPRSRDSSTHNGSSSEIFTAAGRQGRAAGRRSGAISRYGGSIGRRSEEYKAIYQEADGFTTAEANQLLRSEEKSQLLHKQYQTLTELIAKNLENNREISQEIKRQQGIRAYKEFQSLESTKISPQESHTQNNTSQQDKKPSKKPKTHTR
ncbi:hypothetical protein LS74_000235 [Helicobacter magdeburgensis]|uniref:Uncharacterized protein n=1 Tax=Helicobacter magdeburgensis TaxID=471858 RepID=A0A4U8T2Z0_9HELI|nr:hypothetical protein [Helicobacter magdeburgensis]TLD93815.1 hypothetical protein LS74_000235 [Helicobacter magdeburgensis]